jgi:hypothetical protein
MLLLTIVTDKVPAWSVVELANQVFEKCGFPRVDRLASCCLEQKLVKIRTKYFRNLATDGK